MSSKRIGRLALLALVLAWAPPASAQKFYPDDPMWVEPPPIDTIDPSPVTLSGILEYFTNQFTNPGERQPENGVIPALNSNTLGEVPDSPWFTNRHARRRLTLDELVAGTGINDPPRIDGPWRVVAVKQFGDRTGMLMVDEDDTLYLLRFDKKGFPELATGAEMVSSKFYYAAGYHTLENYLVTIGRDRLVLADGAEKISSQGAMRDLIDEDIDSFLKTVDRRGDGTWRAVATRAPYQTILGNYQFYATRSDDPNDIVPHEHRRDLRGLWVLHAWLANHEFNPANTLESIATDEGGRQYIRRRVIDFFKTLGAGELGYREPREGNEQRFELSTALKNAAGMGFYTPGWMRADYPGIRSVGYFEGERFDADAWVPDVDYATWVNALPDDFYWGAKLVMSFTEEDIRTIVNQGGYTDARATQWISEALIMRRDKIGRAFLARVLPLDNFRVENGRLVFDDLIALHRLGEAEIVDAGWHRLDNQSEVLTFVNYDESDPFAIPTAVSSGEEGEYFAAQIDSRDRPGYNMFVYLRRAGNGLEVVGIERNWPGKQIVASADPEVSATVEFSRYESLEAGPKALLDAPTRAYNETTGRSYTTQEWFDQLSMSERTTFDAVTHALMSSQLTDEEGNDLGTAFDLVAGLTRIAGQYSGRGGDQQFRLYVDLIPEATDILARSTQFFPGHENTVYHVGYPHSWRQEGDVPNMQISVSEDGLHADIDVDYRSSKSPQALFNGHLTSANSDVRAGDNHDRHTARWDGLVNWWQDVFGNVRGPRDASRDLLSVKVNARPTPIPPDRPAGAHPTELYEAAQEFLTDWLVREKPDEAMQFMSERVIACINLDEGAQTELLGVNDAIRAMRDIMNHALDQLPDRDNLTEVIRGVAPQTEEQASRLESHPFEREFSIYQVRNEVAVQYMCSTRRGIETPDMPGGPDALGTYWAVVFRFNARDDQGGALALLFDQLEGVWQLSSYAILEG